MLEVPISPPIYANKKMNNACYYSSVVLLFLLLFSCDSLPSEEALSEMSLEERWGYLEEGQTAEEVHHLLGAPVHTVQRGNIRLDQYDCALCLTKVGKNSGLMAWNPPVKGFEEEADLLHIGEAPSDLPTSILKGLSSSIFSTAPNASAPNLSENLEATWEELFEGIERFRGEEGRALREQLRRHAEGSALELQRFLEKNVGENLEGFLRLQEEMLRQGWEEHGDEAVQFLEQLTKELKDLDSKSRDSSSTKGQRAPEPTETAALTRADQWAAIKRGMEVQQVIDLLGEPTAKRRWSGNLEYTYECFTCVVTFNEQGQVWAWNSPEF